MLVRIITAIVGIAVFIPVLIFSDTLVFPIVIGAVSFVGIYEINKCIGNRNTASRILSYLYCAASFVLTKIDLLGFDFFKSFVFITLIYFFLTFAFSVFSKGKFEMNKAAVTFALNFYVVFCFSSIVLLRYIEPVGKYMYLLVFIGPWISDSAAYFCGRAFGRHKLIPDVSPKKTIEGSIGGIVFTIVAFGLYKLIGENYFGEFSVKYFEICIVGAAVSIVSQIGDLIASLVKRAYDVKDYGNLFPGHGGVLDRFDSVMLTAPIMLLASYLLI